MHIIKFFLRIWFFWKQNNIAIYFTVLAWYEDVHWSYTYLSKYLICSILQVMTFGIRFIWSQAPPSLSSLQQRKERLLVNRRPQLYRKRPEIPSADFPVSAKSHSLMVSRIIKLKVNLFYSRVKLFYFILSFYVWLNLKCKLHMIVYCKPA